MPLILDNVNYIYGEGSGYLNQALRNVSLTKGRMNSSESLAIPVRGKVPWLRFLMVL